MKRDIFWFENRIGKEVCRILIPWDRLNNNKPRIKILDKQHARVLFLIQEEMGYMYFDIEEEKENYINNLNNLK